MKKLNKLLALCLALTMLLLCVPFTASAAESEYGPEDLRSIHGIDYNRITQKATGDGKSYPVELKMGDLTFNGELTGSHGLSYEELNKIINDVLKEKKLTVEQIQLVKVLSKNVEDKAIEHWGLQIMEGLISYIPMNDTIANEIGGWNDIFAYMVHDMDEKNVIEYLADRQRQKLIVDKWKIAENGLKKYEGYLEVVGRAADAIPLAGEMLNTLKVAEEWLKGNERLEKYLKDLEQKMADVNDFYSECSRRANKLAEEKGEGSYSIKFNNATATDTFTFWGISGLMSEWTLSGELVKSDIGESDGVAGTYTGSLNLDIRALDMKETFDARFLSEHNFSYVRQEMESWKHLTGGYVDTVNTNTVLSRSLSGEISAYVQPTSGMSDVNVSGDLASNDKIVFSFDHTIKGKNTSGTIYYSYVTQITSSNPNTINRSYKLSQITNVPMAGTSETVNFDEYSEGAPADIGTVWEPLESEISMTINFGR